MHIDIKTRLDTMNKTQYWLAKQTGISTNTINNIYSGKPQLIRFDTLEKLCEALQCTPNDLIIK